MKFRGLAMVLSAGFFWGIISIFIKALQAEGLSTIEIVFSRVFYAMIALFFYLLLFDRDKLRVKPKDLWIFFGSGVLSLLFFNVCAITSLGLLGVSISTMLLYTSPIFVVFLSAIFFKEKITSKKLLCLVLSMVGFVMLTGVSLNGPLNPLGIVFGVLSGLGYALYSIFSRVALNRGYSGETISLYTFACATLGTFPFVTASGTAQLLFRPMSIGIGLGVGLVCCTIPFLLYTKGLRTVETGKAAIMAMTEPIVALLCGVVLFGEKLGFLNLLGIATILVAIVLLNFPRRFVKERGNHK